MLGLLILAVTVLLATSGLDGPAAARLLPGLEPPWARLLLLGGGGLVGSLLWAPTRILVVTVLVGMLRLLGNLLGFSLRGATSLLRWSRGPGEEGPLVSGRSRPHQGVLRWGVLLMGAGWAAATVGLLLLHFRGPTPEGIRTLAAALEHASRGTPGPENGTAVLTQARRTWLASLPHLAGLVLLGSGIGLLIRVGQDALAHRRESAPSPLGLLGPQGAIHPIPLPRPTLRHRPRARIQDPRILGEPPLTPLAQSLLEAYAAHPKAPSAPSGGPATPLWLHILEVRRQAMALARAEGVPPELAELAALGHDVGKLLSLQNGQRIIRDHARLSAMLLCTLAGWEALSPEARDALSLAVALHHTPEHLPEQAPEEARRLLQLLRHADGLEREAGAGTGDREREGDGPTGEDPTTPGHERLPWETAPTGTQPGDPVEEAVGQILATLKVNPPAPFEGFLDQRVGVLAVLSQAFLRRLGEVIPEPSVETVAERFRRRGMLIETWQGKQGLLWTVRAAKKRWKGAFLLQWGRVPLEWRPAPPAEAVTLEIKDPTPNGPRIGGRLWEVLRREGDWARR